MQLMVDTAISRVARAMDMIPFVLENPGIKVEQLAQKFGVNQKQIIKDLELIFLCGLPGYTPYELIDLTYEDGLVTVIDPQLFDKPRKFTETEGVIIVLGLELLKGSISDLIQLRGIDDLINKLSTRFKVSNSATLEIQPKPAFFIDALKAISQNSALRIKYNSLSKDYVSEKLIKPLRISLKNGFYYLYAFDLDADSDRVYRLDQILSATICEANQSFNHQNNGSLEEFDFELIIANQLITEKYSEIFTEVKILGNKYEVKGKNTNRQWLHRWILSNCTDIEVIEPELLKNEVKKRAKSALALYQQ